MTGVADELESAIAGAAARYPQAVELVRAVQAAGPLLAGPLDWLLRERAQRFWPQAQRLAILSEHMDGSPIEALAEYTVMFLKEQVHFVVTGEYSNDDFDTVREAVYDNPEVMRRYYLEGLMLTHAFWPIHLDIHGFFNDAFVPRVADRGCGLEIGFGHGLYLLEVLSECHASHTHSFDISPYSCEYAARLLRAGGVAESRFELGLADIRQPLPLADDSQEWAVFAEVLEHIPDPASALSELARVLRSGSPLFATTVLFSNAIDHITQFESPVQVGALLHEAGFEVAEERILAVADYVPETKDRTVDLAYIAVHM